MPAARRSASPRPSTSRIRRSTPVDAGGHAQGASTVFGSNLGPAHIHAVARRNQFLDEAARSRQARMATAGRAAPFAGVRRGAGRMLVAIGLRLHGDMARPQPGCPVCDVRLAS